MTGEGVPGSELLLPEPFPLVFVVVEFEPLPEELEVVEPLVLPVEPVDVVDPPLEVEEPPVVLVEPPVLVAPDPPLEVVPVEAVEPSEVDEPLEVDEPSEVDEPLEVEEPLEVDEPVEEELVESPLLLVLLLLVVDPVGVEVEFEGVDEELLDEVEPVLLGGALVGVELEAELALPLSDELPVEEFEAEFEPLEELELLELLDELELLAELELVGVVLALLELVPSTELVLAPTMMSLLLAFWTTACEPVEMNAEPVPAEIVSGTVIEWSRRMTSELFPPET